MKQKNEIRRERVKRKRKRGRKVEGYREGRGEGKEERNLLSVRKRERRRK